MDDAQRVNLLGQGGGGGLARQAAISKMMRAQQLNAAIDREISAVPQVQQPGQMSQAQFARPQGMPVGPDPRAALLRQQQLAEALRRRDAGMMQPPQ